MSDWRKTAQINGDVVFFEYVSSEVYKNSPMIFVWDVDKTYLDTNITSIRGLIRAAREKAFQKKNIPGTATLIRALKEIYSDGVPELPLYFISASPPQMESKIKAKLSIDDIKPYGAFYKDNLKNLKFKKFRRLVEQIGYKTQALLELRLKLSPKVRQILWGDDSESDALIYSLYSDICGDRITEDELTSTLESLNVLPRQIRTILELKESIPKGDPVERIYINLASDTDPDYYVKFGSRMLPTRDTFQMAVDLFQDNRISERILLEIGQVLIATYSFSKEEIFYSFEDLIQRGVVKRENVDPYYNLLLNSGIFLPQSHFTQKTKSFIEGGSIGEEWMPSKIDYLNDYR